MLMRSSRDVVRPGAIIASVILVVAGAAVGVKGVVPGTNGRLAFASDRTGTFEVFTMAADGSDVQQITPAGDTNAITNAPAQDREPSWSPDGRRIAFRSDRAGNNDIWVMNADGSGATNLTNHPAAEGEMSWSPDGTRLVFRRIVASGEQLFVMNADGSGQNQLTSAGQNYRPDWSPDGARIVFSSDRGTGEQIFVMNADGSSQAPLTSPGGGQFDPAWSPDGTRIAFARESAVSAGDAEIIVMNADGSGQQNITNSAPNEYYPAWSPDGSRISIARTPAGVPGSDDRDGEIFVLAPDGSGPTNITNTPAHDTDPDQQRRSTAPPPPSPTPTATATPGASPAAGDTDLAVSISTNKRSVRRARAVGFTVTVRNNGPAVAPRIEVVTTLPSQFAFASVLGNGCHAPAPGGDEVECVFGPVQPRESRVFVIEARARRAGRGRTVAEAVAVSSFDPELSDNRVTERVRVIGRGQRAG